MNQLRRKLEGGKSLHGSEDNSDSETTIGRGGSTKFQLRQKRIRYFQKSMSALIIFVLMAAIFSIFRMIEYSESHRRKNGFFDWTRFTSNDSKELIIQLLLSVIIIQIITISAPLLALVVLRALLNISSYLRILFLVACHHIFNKIFHHFTLSIQFINFVEILLDLIKVMLEFSQRLYIFMQVIWVSMVVSRKHVH